MAKKKILMILFSVFLMAFQANFVKASESDPLFDWAYNTFGNVTIAQGFLTLLIIGIVIIVPLIKGKIGMTMILGILALLYCTAKGYCEIWVTVVLCLIASFFLAKAFKEIIDKY